MDGSCVSRGHALIAAVREAARRHGEAWKVLVPDRDHINLAAEEHEQRAYDDMAAAKAALRDHICDIYGVSIRELHHLASP